MSGSGKITGFDLATGRPTVPRISRTQLVTLSGNANDAADFTAPNGLINDGFLQLTSSAVAAADLDLQGGTLVNNNKLVFGRGAGGSRGLKGTLNNGFVEVTADTTIGSANAMGVNTGSIGVFGATLSLVGKSFKNMNGGSISARGDKALNVEDLDNKKLTNAGTIDFGSGIASWGLRAATSSMRPGRSRSNLASKWRARRPTSSTSPARRTRRGRVGGTGARVTSIGGR